MDRIIEALKENFGIEGFREGQREAVEAVLGGRDAVVVMPTGSGKSLCYQLAAMLLPGTTLVVSPLIALMKDQVDALSAKGIAATMINSTVGRTETLTRLRAMKAGEYRLVYVAPERFRNPEFRKFLAETKVSMFAIDEAHCISQWGHDFRPDYLEIGQVIGAMADVQIMALTATATPSVREDIMRQLGLGVGSRANPLVEVLGFARRNLFLKVTTCSTETDKEERLLDLIAKHRTGIVYVATRKHAEVVYRLLGERLGTNGEATILMYHAALPDYQRSAVQQEFMSAKHPVVVATTAFGMGIDRADIRFVAHWDIPGGVEQYYQEIGRAGRDGQPSICELLYMFRDVKIQEWFIKGANPDPETALCVWEWLKSFGNRDVIVDTDAVMKSTGLRNPIAISTVVNVLLLKGFVKRVGEGRLPIVSVVPDVRSAAVRAVFEARRGKLDHDMDRLKAMKRFVYAYGCRHKYILEYFGDNSSTDVCGGCDNCEAIARRRAPRNEPPVQAVLKSAAVEMSEPASPAPISAEGIESLLARYSKIQLEESRLAAEKGKLRKQIAAIMNIPECAVPGVVSRAAECSFAVSHPATTRIGVAA